MITLSRKLRIVFLISFHSLVAIQARAQSVENSLFWEISGKGIQKPSYLFGTYHLLNGEYLQELPAVKAAFEKADGVVVETELDSAKMLKFTHMMVMADKTLADLISRADYALVAPEVEKSTGMPMIMLGQFKPAFIYTMLTLVYNQESNGDFLKKYKGLPLDAHFAALARKQNKPVNTFESMEEQVALLFNYDPVVRQAELLVELVRTKGEMKKVLKELVTMYVNQDLAGMYALYKKQEKQFGNISYLLDDRNVKWMDTLPGILKSGNRFIAVGALHFTGEKGLIKLLREAGYTVKAVKIN